jgi:hypothetical protein
LAKDATQIAATEENRSRTKPAAQTSLLTMMGEMAADPRIASSFADLCLILDAIDMTLARAERAVGKFPQGEFHTAR